MQQDETNAFNTCTRAIGFLALLAALSVLSKGPLSGQTLFKCFILMIPAYFLFIREARKMTARAFRIMFFGIAFFCLFGAVSAVLYPYTKYSHEWISQKSITIEFTVGMICLVGGFCFTACEIWQNRNRI
jgi:hypothetical protein